MCWTVFAPVLPRMTLTLLTSGRVARTTPWCWLVVILRCLESRAGDDD